MKRLLFLIALAASVLPSLRAESDSSGERIREGEARQEQLRGEAQKLVEQLDRMLDEYQRNGLGAGGEIQTLRALRDSLAKLSVEEMKQVVDLLGKARGTVDTGEAKKRVADAYADQKAILAQMAKLLAEHQRNQQAQEISEQLAKLAGREAVNLQNGITLGQWSGDQKPENFEAAAQANLQGQQAEQEAIAQELKNLAQRMAAFAKDPGDAEQARRFQKGLAAMEKVQPAVESAAAALNGGQLFKAVSDEKTARDTMRQLAKDVAPPQERPEALRAAERELAKAIEDQTELVKNTQKAEGEKDFDRWLEEEKKAYKWLAKTPLSDLQKNATLQRQFNLQKGGQPEELAGLEKKQGDLAGRSDEIAQSLAKNAPEVARDVTTGTDRMQEARGAMADKNAPVASKNARDALAALQAADAKLKQELAKAEALAGKSGDPVKDLQALQQQATALAQRQAEAARNPDKSGQPALAQKVDEFAKQAAAMAPAAAPAAQQAAANAKQAAQAAQPAAAAPAQQAAAQALAQAAQQIAQQAATAQQTQQQGAAAQQAQQQLAELIIAEQKLQVDTAKSASVTAKDKAARRNAFNGQTARQEEITIKTGAFEKTLPANSATAANALDTAQAAMNEAKEQLEKPDGEPAKSAEAKAVEQLYAAQKALQEAVAQAQETSEANGNTAAEAAAQAAAAKLAQAQQDLAQASKTLEEAQKSAQPKAAQQAAAQLAKAAAETNQAAAQSPPANSPAQQAMQNAAQAAVQAAAQAATQNLPAAQMQAAAAQQALAQAQAALSQAQAGLTAANMPAGSPSPARPPDAPSPSGQKPGQKNGPPGTQPAQQDKPEDNATVEVGKRTIVDWKTAFTALPARERAVIEQAETEKYPQEYSAQVEQYLLNLAREGAEKK